MGKIARFPFCPALNDLLCDRDHIIAIGLNLLSMEGRHDQAALLFVLLAIHDGQTKSQASERAWAACLHRDMPCVKGRVIAENELVILGAKGAHGDPLIV